MLLLFSKYYKQFWTSQENFWDHIKKHAKEFKPDDVLDGVQFIFDDANSSTVLSPDTMNKLKKLKTLMDSKVYGEAALKGLQAEPQVYFEIEKSAFFKALYDKENKVLCLTNLDDKIITAHKNSKPKKFNQPRFYKVDENFLLLLSIINMMCHYI